MKVVILGSTGYLGSRLVKKLVNLGNIDILCLKLKNDEAISLNDVKDKISLCDIDDINEINGCYDCLINLCCRYISNDIQENEIYDANFETPKVVFEKFVTLGIRKHITIDTSLPRNVNVYSKAKGKYADYLFDYSKSNDRIKIINVKLENYYGIGEPSNRFIPNTIIKLKNNDDIQLTKGDQKRDFIFAEDVIDILSKLIYLNDCPQYIDLPVGTGEDVSIKELIEYLKQITNSKSNLLFGAIDKRVNEPNTKADISLMKKYGLKCKYTWKEGFLKII